MKTFPLSGGHVASELHIERIHPREAFIVPLADCADWFVGGHCRNPADNSPCTLQRVGWEGKDYSSWAHYNWRTDQTGKVTSVTILQNGNPVARFEY